MDNNVKNKNNLLLLLGGILFIAIIAGIAFLVYTRNSGETASTSKKTIAITPGTTDCGSTNTVSTNATSASKEFLCLAEAAKSCGPAMLRVTDSADEIILYRIENGSEGQCNVLVHKPITPDPQGTCTIDSPQLIRTLIAWAWGRATEADLKTGGQCYGSYFDNI